MLCGQWQAVTFKSGGYRGRYIETVSGQRLRLALCMQARLDRVSEGGRDSITSQLYIQSAGCLCDSPVCLALAYQAGSRLFATTGKKGAYSSRLDDCTSEQQNLLYAFPARQRHYSSR